MNWRGSVRRPDNAPRAGYRITREYAVPDDGIIDLSAENDRERVAIEVETGKSDIAENLHKLAERPFDRIVFVATSPTAIAACTQAMDSAAGPARVELQTWLDLD